MIIELETSKTNIAKFIIIALTFLCLLTIPSTAQASFSEHNGDDWSMTSDGVLTIESNQGWLNCLKHKCEEKIVRLVIGAEVTNFRLYNLSSEVPSPDFYSKSDIRGYDRDGQPYYDYYGVLSLSPREIIVDQGNRTFEVKDGLLINNTTDELVLSERGVTDVVIPEGVKTITRNAFFDRELGSVSFPSSLEVIGEDAFSKCKNLESVVIPNSVIQIGGGAFSMCTALKQITLPEGLQAIESYMFHNCAIERIDIPDTVYMIGSWAFLECEQLKQIELPQGLKSIGTGAFIGCAQLTQIDLPEGLESIGEQAFHSCYSLQRVILPDSLHRIGNEVFGGCRITTIRIPPRLAFLWHRGDGKGYILNPYANQEKSFRFYSVDTVVFTGSDYDFGYHAITDAKNVYFLSTPPEEVGDFLDKETVENIYCSDEYEFQWTRSKVASWVRQKLTILPAAELNALVEEKINTTPLPLETPTPTPSATPAPTQMMTPAPTATPEMERNETDADPILFVFAAVLAVVVAGIVLLALRIRKKEAQQKRARAKKDG